MRKRHAPALRRQWPRRHEIRADYSYEILVLTTSNDYDHEILLYIWMECFPHGHLQHLSVVRSRFPNAYLLPTA